MYMYIYIYIYMFHSPHMNRMRPRWLEIWNKCLLNRRANLGRNPRKGLTP